MSILQQIYRFLNNSQRHERCLGEPYHFIMMKFEIVPRTTYFFNCHFFRLYYRKYNEVLNTVFNFIGLSSPDSLPHHFHDFQIQLNHQMVTLKCILSRGVFCVPFFIFVVFICNCFPFTLRIFKVYRL